MHYFIFCSRLTLFNFAQLCALEVALPFHLFPYLSAEDISHNINIMSKRPAQVPLNKGGQKQYRSNNEFEHDNNSLSTVPIFLKKLAKMIETCDISICSWSDDGEMFVVKNPDRFAEVVIPQYFDHNSKLTLLPSLIIFMPT